MWDWGDAKTYLHDEIATDKRNPTVNAWGKLYSATEDSTDNLPILDPKTNTVTYLKMTPRDPKTPRGAFIQSGNFPRLPSPYWGDGDDLEQPDLGAQSDARSGRPAVADRAHPRAADAGVLPQGLGPSLGEAVPDGRRRPPGRRCTIRRPSKLTHDRHSASRRII